MANKTINFNTPVELKDVPGLIATIGHHRTVMLRGARWQARRYLHSHASASAPRGPGAGRSMRAHPNLLI